MPHSVLMGLDDNKCMNKKSALVMAFFMVAISGCASMNKAINGQNDMPGEDERKTLVSTMPELTADQKTKFIAGEPWLGMTQSQLNAHFGGTPGRSQNKLTAQGSQVVSLYRERVGNWKTGMVTKYYRATMTDGKLSEISELDNIAGSFDKL